MQVVNSKLEPNVFEGIKINKGLNYLKNKDLELLKKNKAFNGFYKQGLITVETKQVKQTKETNPQKDFTEMSYDELKAYVKENNIKVSSMKKADILAALAN